jgi:plastocyanin
MFWRSLAQVAAIRASKLARVRPTRLALPLAVLLSFALATPAHAAFDWSTNVIDYEFQPKEQKISVGDSVTWNFTVGGHTSTSLAGQPDSWKSIDDGTNATGDTFSHTFNTRGRYQYVCSVHKSFMKGVIEVGTDTVIDSIDNFRTRRFGNRVRIGFKLNEPATVKYRLRGPSARRVKLGRLARGRRGFTLRHLRRGSYRGVLTVVDDFDKKITRRNSFVIR